MAVSDSGCQAADLLRACVARIAGPNKDWLAFAGRGDQWIPGTLYGTGTTRAMPHLFWARICSHHQRWCLSTRRPHHQGGQKTRLTATMAATSVQAAKSEVEIRVKRALEYINENPDAKIATAAREFDIPSGRLKRRVQGIKARLASQQLIQSYQRKKRLHYVAILTGLIALISLYELSLLPMLQITSYRRCHRPIFWR